MVTIHRRCPAVPSHGEALAGRGETRLYCPHQEHDGRSDKHPLGGLEQTRSHFTKAEVESGILAD